MKYGILETGEIFNSRRGIISELGISVTALKRHLGKTKSWLGLTLYRIKEKTCRICGCILNPKNKKKGNSNICVPCHRSESNANSQRHHLKAKYDLSLADYCMLLEDQQHCCAICGKHKSEQTRNLAVDHDHNTGGIRGLLCDNCNRGLGLFGDDAGRLARAIHYLHHSPQ